MAVPPSRRSTLRRRLLAWWDAGHRDLPWRGADPYGVWLSEVMLQQTRVDAVRPYYARFRERFPTLEALAAADEGEVLALWSGLGYYARARALHRAAREALRLHGGLPRSIEALRALPGFGPYTSAAVASIAFGLRAAAVDGNVARVLSRLFAIDGAPEAAATRAALAGTADALVPAARAGDWNQALMDLGATVCARAAPRCDACPLAPCCLARAAGRERELPVPRRRAAARRLELACAVVARDGAVLLERRASRGLFGGLWELPSVPLADDADAAAALRGLAARGLRVAPGAELARVERALTHRRLVLRAFACTLRGRPPADARFASVADLDGLGVATAMRRLVDAALTAGRQSA